MKHVFSAMTVLFTTAAGFISPVVAADGEPPVQFDCSRDIIHTEVVSDLPAGVTRHARRAGAPGGLTIILNAGPGLLKEPEALATFQNAAHIWESFFYDPITVVIDADLEDLPSGVLGRTMTRRFNTEFTEIRDAMVDDGQVPEPLLDALPTLPDYNVILPDGFVLVNELRAAKADLRALGFDMSFDDDYPDATISFSTGFLPSFDFDPSDGITSIQFDFEGIAVHELGHALGFTSGVDFVDCQMDPDCQKRIGGPDDSVRLRPLDMFRLRPGDAAIDFTTSPRIGAPGNFETTHKFFDGFTELGLSTGSFFGDGNQASHWKANELTGLFIGVMDPTLGRGERVQVTENDVRALGLIGWDLLRDCNDNGVQDADDITNGTSQDCNGNGVPDECDTDCNSNGMPDDCETFTDCNASGVPDECELAGNDCNGNGTPDECDAAIQDCNASGIPDDCELLDNDCNGNGVPDECDTDCQPNGVPDDCDIAQGTSLDCQPNGVPDLCDVASGSSPDLNHDGIPDDCCAENADCDDGDVLTFDQCLDRLCQIVPARYGDLAGLNGLCGPDGIVDIMDIFAVLDGFTGRFAAPCDLFNMDIAGPNGSCGGDGQMDISDIFAVLDAFTGSSDCGP